MCVSLSLHGPELHCLFTSALLSGFFSVPPAPSLFPTLSSSAASHSPSASRWSCEISSTALGSTGTSDSLALGGGSPL